MLEDLRSQFRVFGEGLSIVGDQLHDLNKKVETMDKKVDKLEKDMVIVKGELAIIRHNQVTRDEFKLLESRVLALEKKNR